MGRGSSVLKNQTRKSPSPVDVHVGKRVRMRRLMVGISQTELGEAVGVTFQQLQKYEKGVNRLGAGRLQQVAKALKVPVSFFFEDPLEPGVETKAGHLSQDFVSDFLTTAEGLALSRAFMRIRDPRTRRSVVKLVEDIVSEGKFGGHAFSAPYRAPIAVIAASTAPVSYFAVGAVHKSESHPSI